MKTCPDCKTKVRDSTTSCPNCNKYDSGDFILSMAVGAVTDSAILGGLIGGDIAGAIIGDLFDGDLFD